METKHEKKRIGTVSTAVAQTNLQCRVVAQARTAVGGEGRGALPAVADVLPKESRRELPRDLGQQGMLALHFGKGRENPRTCLVDYTKNTIFAR